MKDLQKANMWKRISAALLDVILIAMVAVGMALLLSFLLGYNKQKDKIDDLEGAYAAEYGVDFDISAKDFETLSEEEKAQYNTASDAFYSDQEVNRAFVMLMNLSLIIVTFGILLAFLILELVVPLVLGSGQTIGKKIFGIGVMREDGVKLSPMLLFVRTILGKYTVETMLPVFIILMLFFNMMGIAGVITLAALLILQVVLLIITPTRSPLHDKLAHTVTVDFASQRIFDTVEDKMAYYKRLHDETHGAD